MGLFQSRLRPGALHGRSEQLSAVSQPPRTEEVPQRSWQEPAILLAQLMAKKTIAHVAPRNGRVLLRADFSIPLNEPILDKHFRVDAGDRIGADDVGLRNSVVDTQALLLQ